jgi:lipopolysaccharide transport system ATP-binding protein
MRDGHVIEVAGISKRYRLGETHVALLSERVERALRLRGGGEEATREFWALRDVSFSIERGEILGVIGRNGAGKSTLLKILARITAPTAGRAELRGRVASLLEVGTGFHPELTGRENVFLNGAILGMSRREVAARFDEIVAFAGVERFVDTPVKRYSSGMYVRLAFAVAAHVEASILLVDEVLSVGDAEFQKRSLGKMGDVARSGRTVIFVSHNLTVMRSLCTRGLLLEGGAVASLGPVTEALARYASGGRTGAAASLRTPEGDGPAVVGVEVRSLRGANEGRVVVGAPFVIAVTVAVPAPGGELGPFLHLFNEEQVMVFSSGSFFDRSLNGLSLDAGVHEFLCEVPGHLLNDGEYSLDVMLVRDRREVVLREPAVLSFVVHDEGPAIEGWNWRPAGATRPETSWSVRRTVEASPEGELGRSVRRTVEASPEGELGRSVRTADGAAAGDAEAAP